MHQSQTSQTCLQANKTPAGPKHNLNTSIPFVSALLLFFILLTTVPPSVYHADSGETITASYTLGIQHPPGYPLFTLIGKLFCFLPIGDVCFRVYLLSLFLAMVDFLLIYVIFSKLLRIMNFTGYSPLLPVFPSAVFMAGYTIWEQAIIAKGGIYILNILFTLVLTLVLISLYEGRNHRHRLTMFYMFCFLFGLSLGNHHMSQLIMLPGYIFLLYKSGFFKSIKTNNYFIAFSLFLISILIYIYLPIRARQAYLNWGDPSTFKSFFQTLTRWEYSHGEITRSFLSSLRQAGKFFSASIGEYAVVGVVFIIAGAFILFKKEKALFIYLMYIPAVFLAVTAVYLNLTADRLYIMETYITPVYVSLSLFLGFGILWIAVKISAIFKRRYIVEICCCLAVLIPQLVFGYPRLDKASYYYAYDYNLNMLLAVENNAILFATGDGIIFPMWYLRYVKHIRPDVTLVGTAVLPMRWVRDGIKKQNPDVALPAINTDNIGTESTGAIINAMIRLNFSRYPIYITYNPTEEGAIDPHLKLMPKACVFKIMFKDYAYITDQYLMVNKNLWKLFNLRGIFDVDKKYVDKSAVDLYIHDYAVSMNSMAQYCENEDNYKLALEYFTMAHKFYPQDYEYLYNMGTSYFNLGDIDKSVELFRQTIDMNPKYENAWYNLGVVYYKQNKLKDALDCFMTIKSINPGRTDINPTIEYLEKAVQNK